ncbi:MAG: hypothetical protein HUU22_04945 [Phycisphaerae bacterium]|nr:hypothetical protein [Phycisphaerae bacterium]NUQ45360.1 hypothetical protein [Phycisphaerae bacterium]
MNRSIGLNGRCTPKRISGGPGRVVGTGGIATGGVFGRLYEKSGCAAAHADSERARRAATVETVLANGRLPSDRCCIEFDPGADLMLPLERVLAVTGMASHNGEAPGASKRMTSD